MKKFVIWISTIILSIIAIDLAVGFYFNHHRNMLNDYEVYHGTEHLFKNAKEDIIILGPSVARNSLNSQMIQDSLGLTTYNAGANAQEFPYYLTELEILLKRHTPKIIILAS